MTGTTCQGSCHCGAVRFAAEIDLRNGTRRCNCSYCTKTRFWKGFVTENGFRLLSGEHFLSAYGFGEQLIRHVFCTRCGVALFGQGRLAASEFHVVNVACLDDIATDELLAAPVAFEDGRNDDWWSQPAEIRHL